MDAAVLKWMDARLAECGLRILDARKVKKLTAQAMLSNEVIEAIDNRFDLKRVTDNEMLKQLAGSLLAAPFVIKRSSAADHTNNCTIWRVEMNVLEDGWQDPVPNG